jgi:hypothetical protein
MPSSVLRRVEERFDGVLGRISGKAVEDKIAEYSEVYGEVLLGLHRDLENHSRLLQDCQRRLVAQAKQIQHLRFLCILSFVLVIAIGMAVWLIR